MINTGAPTSGGAEVLGVDFAQRIITVVAAPYNQVAYVTYRGQPCRESFAPGAFDSINLQQHQIRVNRDHVASSVVGKVVSLNTRDPRGLIAEIRVPKTVLGDETLQLASEDCLSASVAFGVNPGGEIYDRVRGTRRVTSAFVDHIALTASPAYAGARVMAVRATPNIDALQRDPVFVWAQLRCDQIRWARQRRRR
jgi:HK97 family phage prohead protease